MEHQNHHLIYTYPSLTLKLYIILNGHDHITQVEGKYKKYGEKVKINGVRTSLIYRIFGHASGVSLIVWITMLAMAIMICSSPSSISCSGFNDGEWCGAGGSGN